MLDLTSDFLTGVNDFVVRTIYSDTCNYNVETLRLNFAGDPLVEEKFCEQAIRNAVRCF